MRLPTSMNICARVPKVTEEPFQRPPFPVAAGSSPFPYGTKMDLATLKILEVVSALQVSPN